ncbi:MAG: phospho-sugar mutase [Peptococcaceae bacterium]|nr:phospho-sugar mutase [Peptococcaceae bacterium]
MDAKKAQRVAALYHLWREDLYFDEETRRELTGLAESPEEVFDRFYADLEFGTAGLRGVLGAGSNRMNVYVVRRVTQALSDTIKRCGPEACARGVVIAYDCRHFSDVFAEETARVLAANGIRSYVFDALRPTPELSFAVRKLNTMAGVMVTASHNPQEHNGYKVYWEDGSQVGAQKADEILRYMSERDSWRIDVPAPGSWESWRTLLGADMDESYMQAVEKTLVQPELIRERGHDLSIVYSPLHGTGNVPVRRMLAWVGFSQVHVVPEQELPDGSFPTVRVPNPEDPGAFAMALDLAKSREADIVLISDPDADRLGLAVRDAEGVYRGFTGNQIGILLMTYLIRQKRALGHLEEDAVVVKTVASTDLAEPIARQAGVEVRNVHVGFKFIGEQIMDMETTGRGHFLLGFEESLGYLAGTYARDKDAVGAAVLLSEAALYYKCVEKKSLWEVLQELHEQYGYYDDTQRSITLTGINGRQTMEEIMRIMRSSTLRSLAGYTIERVEDYKARISRDLPAGTQEEITLPEADVLRFSLQGGGFVMVRPSGTEPKIKFYYSLKSAGEDPRLRERVEEAFLAPVRHLLGE